jgi:hypothetical protein
MFHGFLVLTLGRRSIADRGRDLGYDQRDSESYPRPIFFYQPHLSFTLPVSDIPDDIEIIS